MIKVSYRSFQNYYHVPKNTNPVALLREMVGNQKEFDKFKKVQETANRICVKFHFRFSENETDKIILTMSEPKKLPPEYGRIVFLNRFKRRKNQVEIPTMPQREARWLLYDNFHVLGKSKSSDYPVETVVFDPKQPYSQTIADKLKEIATKIIDLTEVEKNKLQAKYKL